MAKSAPDGHSLILVPSTHGTARALYASLAYEESEFVAIGLIASTPYVFVVHPDFPANSFGELIKLLKANPGKYNYASTSPGTVQHLGGELKMAGVDMVHIAYKGPAPSCPIYFPGAVGAHHSRGGNQAQLKRFSTIERPCSTTSCCAAAGSSTRPRTSTEPSMWR